MHRFPLAQHPQEPTSLAHFQLDKFSYTSTSINHRGPLTWNHIYGNGNITGIFERHTAQRSLGGIMFRVIREHETLEEICLTDLTTEYNSRWRSKQDTWRKPVFNVVVMSPCLAVKYPQGNACVRRFQIKFLSDRDFCSALAILKDIGCPFSVKRDTSSQSTRTLTSSHSDVGQTGLTSGAHNGFQAPRSSMGMMPPYLSTTQASVVTSAGPLGPSLPPSSSSSSTTLAGSARALSNCINIATRSPFEPSLADARLYKEPPRPNTATGCHDTQTLDQLLPPKRELPFRRPAAKRPRLLPGPADISSLTARTSTPSGKEPEKTTPQMETKPKVATTQTDRSPNSDPNPNPHLPTPATLSLYFSTESTAAERTTKLENWICAHLYDDGFLQLCQDIEAVWSRAALGK